ncbi:MULTISPECIES: nucleoside-diphosphate sugar epimerase/dehydratase [unclassified Pseudoalteromonas]|uniref:polysaccharide biosynthesis protein n=1 Tax=unclassified Pseudoalteromonas TaxID=194690 RepID=UPI0020973560|nr:nucleoside-diphosphate sugar epimerase/dehydratase [Pseudoalteromonas sp. XMcav2-N]MCO7188755.1 polysaccharide biosynthesis protein [Pseudoalteromonas sp. XMcav2-N]
MDRLLRALLRTSRRNKRLFTLLVDCFFIASAFWLSLFVRLDSLVPLTDWNNWLLLFALLPVSLLVFIQLGLYRAVLRFAGAHVVSSILIGTIVSTVTLVLCAFGLGVPIPRTMPIIYAWLLVLSVGGARIAVRAMFYRFIAVKKTPVVIYGAGEAGRQLATALGTGPEYFVSAFIDDDKAKQNSVIQGVPVVAFQSIYNLIDRNKVDKILLALPSASRKRRQEIIYKLEKLPVEVMTVPGMADVIEGKASLNQIKEVEIEDLLGRDPVDPKPELMAANIKDKVVMVTGAGGSIGSELCRQIVQYNPVKLVLFELSEYGLYCIEKELSDLIRAKGLDTELLPIIGSVQRINRVENCMQAFGVQTVYHAAAYKHVPLVEHNVVEGVRNNVFGTYCTAKAAINVGVETFVLISTDKAVRPTNVMGATKRMAELVLQGLATGYTQGSHGTRFCMVRFGNVLGSSGSVVPLFRRQIKEGGPITLTHPEITRFFMTIPEAAQLVIQAGAMGKGGDVFVLDMGESVKIKDLATRMIHLSGLEVQSETNLDGDIAIRCTGLRPGEKLYEELLIGDDVESTSHERIMTANEVMLPKEELQLLLDALDKACHNFDHEAIRKLLLQAPLSFAPTDDICDLVWSARKKMDIPDNIVSFK